MFERVRDLRMPLRARDFRALWYAQILSELGDWGARVALSLLVYARTGSPALAALVTTVSVLPWVGLGQILATLGDRYPRRRVVIAADLFRAVLWATMALPLPVGALLALAFAAGIATPPFASARAALIPEVVPEDCYGDALALNQITNQLAQVAGFLVGGGVAAVVNPRYALLVNAVTFLLSALSLARIGAGRSTPPRRSTRSRLGGGAHALFTDPYLRRATALGVLPQCSAMAGESLVVVYVRSVLHSGASVVGALAAVVPFVVMVLAALVPRRGDHRRLLTVSALLVAAGSIIGIVGFLTHLRGAAAVVPYAGLGVVYALVVPANTVVGARLPHDVRASAFGLLQGTLMGAQATGAALGGVLASQVDVGVACGVALIPALAFAIYCLARPVVAPASARAPRGTGRDVIEAGGRPGPQVVGVPGGALGEQPAEAQRVRDPLDGEHVSGPS